MEVQAISRNVRISPRKVRIVANLVRGKKREKLSPFCAIPTRQLPSWLKKPSGAPWQMQKTITI